MGDRYHLNVSCKKCGYIEKDVWYAPTCGFMTTKCPKCNFITNLEEYSGIDAEGCASTIYGIQTVREQRKKIKKLKKEAIVEGN